MADDGRFHSGGQRRRRTHPQPGGNRRLLGFSLADVSLNDNSGIRAIIDSAMVSYERLPMLEIVFDRLVRLMTTSLRNFTSDNVEVSLDRITSVRFGDYLNSIPLPAILGVFKAEEWENFGLVTVNSSLIYSIIDVLLGGRRGQTAMRVEGRPYTTIETNLVKRMIEVVLADAELAFKPLSPVKFNIDRLETNPRFAAISRPANAAILVRLRIDMEDRGGNDRAAAALRDHRADPRRAVADVHGREIRPRPDLGRPSRHRNRPGGNRGQRRALRGAAAAAQMMKLDVGDTLMLELKSDALVIVRCGDVTLTEGRMGRVGDRVAVRVAKPLRKPRTTFAMFEKAGGPPTEWRHSEQRFWLSSRAGRDPAPADDHLLHPAQQAAQAAQGRRADAARDDFRADHRHRDRRARDRRPEADGARTASRPGRAAAQRRPFHRRPRSQRCRRPRPA